jgi:hypothetical protein
MHSKFIFFLIKKENEFRISEKKKGLKKILGLQKDEGGGRILYNNELRFVT